MSGNAFEEMVPAIESRLLNYGNQESEIPQRNSYRRRF